MADDNVFNSGDYHKQNSQFEADDMPSVEEYVHNGGRTQKRSHRPRVEVDGSTEAAAAGYRSSIPPASDLSDIRTNQDTDASATAHRFSSNEDIAQDTAPKTAPTTSRDYGAEASEKVRRVMKSPTGFFEEMFPGHGNAVLFGLIGLITAILLFWVGLWRALIVVFLILLGVSYGQYLDGKPSILKSVLRLINRFTKSRDNK
ncbi:MAG: DUF2273 domain-containing protein [Atopobiaceae bacterium]|nr:DUF2273 domain-containing protein [Atopobiaceae bacterium]